ncbi:TPA: DNA polymerase III subunit gamma/tau [candidate division CPR2 bacterium]|uniref:DNA polymerase III subunit gamma/tau n=1 Tax=candidate division CPR2 bacterium GW2011_GWC1_41_48 TaxID=1618344 RepID=A0A0G0ZA29_UNCC2|nr:MAG: polymerase III, subunit gamma and tau protein [candidate division CPR2 bacterium GW2011_GWC2_39_35]KKR27807.1 MAG: polymerase III, subunit gamma and tau protein [candidate division CPR2 bacterium GW2011_GWD2_39_7]KKS09908.1 MAG: DNA polymerase III, subunit gamma and tau, DNA polymerase III subunit gamma/tau [candidate division CPR2 bacterium GW2011_GWC1_41_48]OGB71893.1 MAG: DNA polymerase III, subunit gamma and tau [candidate division CPR2 bacterium GWD2_39_7]HBG81701.1 DNA polymerase 
MTTALYRKYRPGNFEEVTGQEHITKTLKNAIGMGQISHAYLFTGPRGVGKTSIARIFAKTINCKDIKKGEACNKCVMCKSFIDGKAIDMIEIDAASNRGIDEIRDLRDKIKFAPNQAKYKVFIIDEVHMLTKEAFNALLKTLEEPPAHAIFVLATTEIHKVPDTIISRCQRFDFERINTKLITARLEDISKKEGFEYELKALEMIAVEASGGLRDAISLLDQVSSFNAKKITEMEIKSIIGRADLEQIFNVALLMAKGKTKEPLDIINDLVLRGGDVNQFVKNLLEFLREVFLFKLARRESEKIPKEYLEKVSNATSERELIDILEILANVEKQSKLSSLPQLPLEIALVKIGMSIRGQIYEGIIEKKVSEKSSKEMITDTGSNKWEELLLEIKSSNHSVHAFLKAADPEIDKGVLVLAFLYQFHKERIEDVKNKMILEKAIAKVYGEPLRVKCVLKKGEKMKKEEDKKSDIVAKSIEIFGGEIVG